MSEKDQMDAMSAFSSAIALGVNVMDLPDAPSPEAKKNEVSDELATMMYSEQVNDKTIEDE